MNQVEKEKLAQDAIDYVKKNKNIIIDEIVGNITPVEKAVAIFMAGSPGAGKTEFSKYFLEKEFGVDSIVRIDPDEIRETLPGYNGENAYLFQGAVIVAIEKVLDYVFARNFHFLLEGTFSNQDIANKNIEMQDRLITSATATWTITDDLSFRGRVASDFTSLSSASFISL